MGLADEMSDFVAQRVMGEITAITEKIDEQLEVLQVFEKAIEAMETSALAIEARAESSYEKLLSQAESLETANSQVATDLHNGMKQVVDQAINVARVFTELNNSVAGENGMTVKTSRAATILESNVNNLALVVNSFHEMKNGALAKHELAVSSLKTGLVAVLSACAGAGFVPVVADSKPIFLGVNNLGLIGAGLLAVGVAFGFAICWGFTAIQNHKEQN